MVDSHYEILWADKSGSGLGQDPTENYVAGLHNSQKQAIISQQSLRSNMIGILIKNSLNTDSKLKLRSFRSAYTFNNQDDRAKMFFVILKMVRSEKRSG